MGSSAARPTPYVLKYRFFAPKLASTISMVLCDFSMVLCSKLLPTIFHGALCVCVCVCNSHRHTCNARGEAVLPLLTAAAPLATSVFFCQVLGARAGRFVMDDSAG